MAITAWSAKVLQQRDLLVGERPGVSRPTNDRADASPSHSIGAKITERTPIGVASRRERGTPRTAGSQIGDRIVQDRDASRWRPRGLDASTEAKRTVRSHRRALPGRPDGGRSGPVPRRRQED